jgi:3' terminal RNA ribose 2'-O-methyltransferase Hen1
MLLTLSTTQYPATDLGYLLHKNPARVHTEQLPFGTAAIFYPTATPELCTAALLVTVDPIALVRGRGPQGEGGQLSQYVNDRPYAANSFLSVALGRILSTALSGRSKDRQTLADAPIPLTAHLPVIAARGGAAFVRALFEPLGYTVELTTSTLDASFPDWGQSPYVALTLSATTRLQDLLTHLYILIPVLDNEKHYWVGEDEIEKRLKRGEGWLPTHPAKEAIVSRYLKRQSFLTRTALTRLIDEESSEADETELHEDISEPTQSLHTQRLATVHAALREAGAKSVLDLGCGSGKLLRLLLEDRQFERILGMDVAYRTLEVAKDRLRLDNIPERQRARIQLIQGSLVYRDRRLNGFDAAAVVEVIEHLDAPRLAAFERVLFEFAHPAHIVLTTPNADYNALFPTLPAGELRHSDHRFEWTRAQFESWANRVATKFGYLTRFAPIGPLYPEYGAPTQMAIFSLREATA